MRMDDELPFIYWTANDRYSIEDQPSFDVLLEEAMDDDGVSDESDDDDDDDEPQTPARELRRLYKQSVRGRDNSAIIIPGRNWLPEQHAPHIRDSIFKRPVDLPPVPDHMMQSHVSSAMSSMTQPDDC